MAKDCAKYIWELSKKEYEKNHNDLKNEYLKKFENDRKQLQKEVKDCIQNWIKTNSQVLTPQINLTLYAKHRYMLNLSKVVVSNITHETYSRSRIKRLRKRDRQKLLEELRESPYAYFEDETEEWIKITNKHTQDLIDYAIIPLKLKWSYGAIHLL